MDRSSKSSSSEPWERTPTVVTAERPNRPPSSSSSDGKAASRAEEIELFKLMVEMADRVSQRRQAANSFYLTLNTLIFGSSAYIRTSDSPFHVIIAVSLAGILASLLWIAGIDSYKTLNTAKFSVIQEMEKGLHFQPFGQEWRLLDPNQDGIRHRPFHVTELLVPRIFIGLYLAQIVFATPWLTVGKALNLAFSTACGQSA